jgi:DNA helicase HerA-like ATPase
MDASNPTTSQAASDVLGRVTAISGAQASIGLTAGRDAQTGVVGATVGRFLGIIGTRSIIVGLITEISEQPAQADGSVPYSAVARLDLLGEIKPAPAGGVRFQRGVTDYPSIGAAAALMSERELRLVYEVPGADVVHIGQLQQDSSVSACINIHELLSKHFAILGTTGVGKSSGVAVILQQILQARPNLRIFLVDPHNEYASCFGERAQVLTPRNLKLPFWLFNFEEIVDVIFGGRPGVEEETELLFEAIPAAKAAYLQYRAATDRSLTKRRDPKTTGYTADTPVPYRADDLVNLIDERMGKLENRSSRMTYHKLLTRIQTVRNDPRYAFIFENANVGGDTMAEVLSLVFRLPPNGKPMTIMQLAGFPAEVVDAVVSVVSRMAFDFGLWSDGVAPLLFVCEEAHRYAPADQTIGFGPTRRALSRIAKEGRKYGVFLGLVTQRPAEIDARIISQCNTLFVMRMSNDRDQALIRSAVSDAAASILKFVPSLGTREVFAFGPGVAIPTRLKFKDLPPDLRPHSEASTGTRIDSGANVERDFLAPVIERWRSATMSQRAPIDDDARDFTSAGRDEFAAPQSAYAVDASRYKILRKPLDGP